jgi:hypothetical protein
MMIAVISGANSRSIDLVGDKDVGAVLPELVSALIGDDDAKQKGEQTDDGQGIEAGTADVEQDGAPADTRRVRDRAGEGECAFADETEQSQRLFKGRDNAVAQILERGRSGGSNWRRLCWVDGLLCNDIEQSAELRVQATQFDRDAFIAQPMQQPLQNPGAQRIESYDMFCIDDHFRRVCHGKRIEPERQSADPARRPRPRQCKLMQCRLRQLGR